MELNREGEQLIFTQRKFYIWEKALKFICGLPCVDFSYIAFRSKEEIANACRIANLSHIVTDGGLADIRTKVGARIEKACTGY